MSHEPLALDQRQFTRDPHTDPRPIAMLLRIAFYLSSRSPRLRRALARWWYGVLAKKETRQNWTFMNFGLVPPDGVVPRLDAVDEADRLCIQLYHRVVAPVDLAGARVLEVGSGRGGGASFIARYHHPAQVTGADFAPAAVALCRNLHAGVPNLEFTVGDAERLPFRDASFDAVVNVESSHCYGDIEKFLAETLRVLRPGGHFLYADLRSAPDMAALSVLLDAQSGWERIDHEDITAAVVAALEADDARKRKFLAEFVRPRMRGPFGEFVGLVGGKMHEGFCNREFVYQRFAFRRR